MTISVVSQVIRAFYLLVLFLNLRYHFPLKLLLPGLRYGSKNWELLPELAIEEGDIVLDEKCTYDMFHNTRLQQLLDGWGINTVIISGVMTNLCCETTARCIAGA
jgi:nicotinamidase-related amidase